MIRAIWSTIPDFFSETWTEVAHHGKDETSGGPIASRWLANLRSSSAAANFICGLKVLILAQQAGRTMRLAQTPDSVRVPL